MLFSRIIYGPIHSRRLGNSLGINLLPSDRKICNFDCVYCECGFAEKMASKATLPTVQEYAMALEEALKQADLDIDTITFSGNGEPTLHPNFLEIVQVTRTLRDRYFPNAKISLLSNATKIDTKKDAIMLCDNRILKLDSAVDATLQLIDRPVEHDLTAEKIIEKLQMFEGDFVLQTCFLRGEYQGKKFDNTTPNELQAWYEAVKKTNPKQIMVYAIDRQTPVKTIEKLTFEEIQSLVLPLQEQGFDVQIFA